MLSVFGYQVHLGIFYIFFALFWLVGFSNAVNLTDGIDGLASISVVISLSAYGVIAYVQNQLDILLVILAMIGGLLGFFVFNHKPAKVFHGRCGKFGSWWDAGSYFMALHQEWTLCWLGLSMSLRQVLLWCRSPTSNLVVGSVSSVWHLFITILNLEDSQARAILGASGRLTSSFGELGF